MARLAALIPVLGRPERVEPLLDSIEVASAGTRVYFVCDPNDEAELEALEAVYPHRADRLRVAGSYAEKINYAVARTEEPLILLGADDLAFRAGWLEAAEARLTPGIGVVGTNDLGNPRVIAGEHSTHPLLTRAYAELPCIDGCPGPLFEGYQHNFCDTELVATAKYRGTWAFAEDSIVEHLHPIWGKGTDDETYRRGSLGFLEDARTFKERSRLWA